MTSSCRHIKSSDRRWDYSVRQYKSTDDPFCEKDLTSILFLAHGRPEITKRCLLSTLDGVEKHDGEVEWILMENGSSDEVYDFFNDLQLERKVVIRQQNYGINEALNQMWALSRGEWCFIHENDWELRANVNFLGAVCDIMNEQQDTGIIQLRAVNDPCENWGYGKPEYSPWSSTSLALSAARIKVWEEHTENGHRYFLSDFPNGFNNNPIVIRKSVYRTCGPYPEAEIGTDPRHGETLYQERVAGIGCVTAHIGRELYYHAGQKTTKAT